METVNKEKALNNKLVQKKEKIKKTKNNKKT